MKNRTLLPRLRQRFDQKHGRLLLVTGARQVGKTTLVRHAFPQIPYLSFDDPSVRPAFTRLSASDWIARYPIAILDEVQKAPTIIETLKAVHDQDPTTRYLLLGSSQVLLLDGVRESLAGRVAIEELWPLTIPEMNTDDWSDPISASRLLSWLKVGEYDLEDLLGVPALDARFARSSRCFEGGLQRGGMPAVSDPDLSEEEIRDWLRDYQRTYLERDVADLAAVRDLEPFVLAQRVLAERTGSLLNLSELARTVGIATSTARRFLRYLDLSYQVVVLQPWHRNDTKRLVKAPKVHFLDPGVMRAVTKRSGAPTGAEFESAVVSEIARQLRSGRVDASLYHLRTHDGREVDLLIELEEGFIAIEIKKAAHVGRQDARHLTDVAPILNKPLLAGLVLSNDADVRLLSPGVLAASVPWLLG
jgi:uncharacterized protein